MTKYTKRRYNNDIAANEAAIASVQAELASYNDRAEAGEQITEALSAAWNAAHDREWELEQERMAEEETQSGNIGAALLQAFNTGG